MLRLELAPKSMLAAVFILAGCWLLLHLLPILLVLIVALMLVGTLAPASQWLEGRGMRRSLSIATVFGSLLILILAFLSLTMPALFTQAAGLIRQEPLLRERLATYLNHSPSTASFAQWLRNLHYGELARSLGEPAFRFSTRLLEGLALGMSAIFLALYMVIDRDCLRGGLFAVVPRTQHMRLGRVLMKLETIVGGYIRGQVMTSALMAGFAFLLLTACQVPNAMALAAFAGVVDVLPYIGAFLTIVPITLAAMSKGPVITAVVIVLMLAYEEFESRFLVPRIYGRALRLPSSVVFFSLLTGGSLMGITGALLALPVAATIRMLVEELSIQLPGDTEQPEDKKQRRDNDQDSQEYLHRVEGKPAEQAAAVAVEMAEEKRRA